MIIMKIECNKIYFIIFLIKVVPYYGHGKANSDIACLEFLGGARTRCRPRRMHVKVRFTAVMLVLFLERMKTAA